MFASLFEEMLHAHPSHRWIHAAGSEKTSKKMKEHLLHVKDERAKYLTTWLFGDSRRTSDGPVEAEPSLAESTEPAGHPGLRQRSLHRWEESCKRKVAEELREKKKNERFSFWFSRVLWSTTYRDVSLGLAH